MDPKLIEKFNLVPLDGNATANQFYSSGCDLMKAKYYRESLVYLNAALNKVNVNTIPPTYLRNLAWAHYNLKEYKNAAIHYQDALDRFDRLAKIGKAADEYLHMRIEDCKKMLGNIKAEAPEEYFNARVN
jgi:outer membrane protein assembly factor BamD (BamD/ComL family)